MHSEEKVSILAALVFFIINVSPNNSEIDVAFEKKIIPHCEKDSKKSNVKLGDNSSKFYYIDNQCKDINKVGITVIMSKEQNIGSVTVFSANDANDDEYLDYFYVRLKPYPETKKTVYCGQYTGKYLSQNLPMRVNCDINNLFDQPISKVSIIPSPTMDAETEKKSAVLNIEINLLEFSSEISYYGCYREFNGQPIEANGTCKQTCAKLGFKFMSLNKNEICYCGSIVPSEPVDDKDCSYKCETEPDLNCSHSDANPVYIARMPHIYAAGCYEAKNPLDLYKSNKMTPAMCIKRCAIKKMIYAHLQFGNNCHCKNEITGEKLDNFFCNITCPIRKTSCGGNDVAMVYTGCSNYTSDSSCIEIYRCLDDNIDDYGRCLGPCSYGFEGQYCVTRNSDALTTMSTTTTTTKTTTTTTTTLTVPENWDSETSALIVDKELSTSNETRFIRSKGLTGTSKPGTPTPECQKFIKHFSERSDRQLQRRKDSCRNALERTLRMDSFIPFWIFALMLVITIVISSGIGFSFGYWYGKLPPEPGTPESEIIKE